MRALTTNRSKAASCRPTGNTLYAANRRHMSTATDVSNAFKFFDASGRCCWHLFLLSESRFLLGPAS